MLDDPATATIFRVSGDPPYPDPANPAVPPTILPRHVTLRDRQTVATIVPFASRHEVPESLLRYLHEQFNKEIEGGDTYPMLEPMPCEKFASYWFQNFGGIMLLGHIESAADVVEGKDWSKECLGTFYIKPNYPGRSSHICNAGFIVTDASRNRGVGRLMGETYLEWAPKLGYKYSVFNLVYETNVVSCKIWDGLGFKRIGRVKGAGNLKSHPDRLVDAIIYGRDLGDAAGGAGSEELVSEERFDKIKFYLKYGRYPNGADRAEKSRLRSAATHYKLLDGDVLMLKDKEVISDPPRQYEIARGVHNQAHGGINKTTATIAERYHWSRIKETVSDVIRNCAECKDTNKASSLQTQQPSPAPVNGLKRPNPSVASASTSKRASPSPSAGPGIDLTGGVLRPPAAESSHHLSPFNVVPGHHQFADPSAISILAPPSHHALPPPTDTAMTDAISRDTHNPMLQDTSQGPLCVPHHAPPAHPMSLRALAPNAHSMPVQAYQPIDPQIIAQSSTDTHLHGHHHHTHHHYPFSHPSPPPPPHHHHDTGTDTHSHSHSPTHHDPDADADAETFQALINAAATDDGEDDDDGSDHLSVDAGVDVGVGMGVSGPTPPPGTHPQHPHRAHYHHTHHHPDHSHHHHHQNEGGSQTKGARARLQEDADEAAAVDRDLEMLIESQAEDDDDDDDGDDGHGARAGDGEGLDPGQYRRLREGLGLGPVQPGKRSMGAEMDVDAKPGVGRIDVAGLLSGVEDDDGGEGGMGDGHR
jgi:GNAT superfamily N-acetyltransferase